MIDHTTAVKSLRDLFDEVESNPDREGRMYAATAISIVCDQLGYSSPTGVDLKRWRDLICTVEISAVIMVQREDKAALADGKIALALLDASLRSPDQQ